MENPIDATKKLLEPISEFCKLQDTRLIYKNLLHLYMLTISYQKEKLRKQSHLQLHQKE